MVINGLQLHVPSAGLAAVIAFALRRGVAVLPAGEAVLKQHEPAKIFAGGREIVLMEVLTD